MRHSIGDDEEFVTIGLRKINIVERTPGSMSCIYHELLNRKYRGWEEPYGDLAETMIWYILKRTSEDIMDIIDICLCSSREDEERGTRGVKLRAETYSWGLTIGEEQCLVVHGGITQSQPRRYGVLIERSCAHTTQEDDRGVLDSIALCGRVDNLIARGVGSRSWGSVIPEANTVHYIVRSGTGSRGYGYIKNHKKTVKNGQARTRESEEYKKKPKIQSRSQKSQASDKVVISKALTSSLSSSSHVEMEKAYILIDYNQHNRMLYEDALIVTELLCLGLRDDVQPKCGKVYNWETATYGKIWDNEDVHDLGSVKTEFSAIVFNDTLTSEAALSCEPTPAVGYLDYFNVFENEFPAIVYNDAQTSKLDLLTELILSPQHIDEFNLNDKTSLSEYDEEEQNVFYFNDLFPFHVIHPNNLISDKDNDDDKIDIEHSSGGPREKKLTNIDGEFIKSGDLEVLES
ncbi:hypothetical protein Tco_0618250 [Tanacetum coccineum]